ncbi:MAG: hypothetical protein L0211_03510 [Planctomycetaceae bacterium]|nr:hypothetical protein [Planctomycetaceae bacterium]
MRYCWFLLAAVLLTALVGCGKPDPRTRPGFVDTTDPKEGLKQLEATAKKAAKTKPGSKPGGS